MSKRLEQRLATLEQASTEQHRVTRIELVDAETSEVAAVIRVGDPPDGAEVVQALEYKHETDPPRRLVSKQTKPGY